LERIVHSKYTTESITSSFRWTINNALISSFIFAEIETTNSKLHRIKVQSPLLCYSSIFHTSILRNSPRFDSKESSTNLCTIILFSDAFIMYLQTNRKQESNVHTHFNKFWIELESLQNVCFWRNFNSIL
jgi:hypothetical protein